MLGLRVTARRFPASLRGASPRLSLRLASTVAGPTIVPPDAPLPPPPHSRSRFRSFLRTFGRVSLVTLVTASGTFYYFAQKDRHPGPQIPQDPSKKTIVILGSGWGATSALKAIDTKEYNVVIISPRNYFLFTPLLPSVTVGTLASRSIIQPTRYIARHKERQVKVYEAEAQEVDPEARTVTFIDNSEIKGSGKPTTLSYDYLIYAVGAETQTFGIPGVSEYSCFLKELWDAEKLRARTMDCIESAAFPDQPDEEVDRLLHMIVVGGGPTGIEFSGELHDFVVDDLKEWYPELADRFRITLIEALPSVLPTFSKQLISYTESTFKTNKIDILTKTMVKEIKERSVIVQNEKGERVEMPFGLLVWAAGNKSRTVTQRLMGKLPATQTNKRGITVDDFLVMPGTNDLAVDNHTTIAGIAPGTIFALGDCTATSYAPTAQVASQQGTYLGKLLNQAARRESLENALEGLKEEGGSVGEMEKVAKALKKAGKLHPFHYSHQGSLAYIGSDKAIADLPFFNGNFASGGVATFLFWRSAYVSTLFSLRNRTLVLADWVKVKLFGRDVSRE